MTTLLCVATLIAASTQFTVSASASAIDGRAREEPPVCQLPAAQGRPRP